jgi:predicted solute-binding protein
MMRLGRIGYINCYPVYGAMDRGLVSAGGELVTGSPTELNGLLAAGELDVSVVSAVEYARDAGAYHLLPDIAISCDGPVRSVALFSRLPVEELDGRTVLVSASSRTSVHLLELLCHDVWKVHPVLVEARAEARDLEELESLPHDAVLVIGDAALLLAAGGRYAHRYDLGEEWKSLTGLPFTCRSWPMRRLGRPEFPVLCAASTWMGWTTRSRTRTWRGSRRSSGVWRSVEWCRTGRFVSSRWHDHVRPRLLPVSRVPRALRARTAPGVGAPGRCREA